MENRYLKKILGSSIGSPSTSTTTTNTTTATTNTSTPPTQTTPVTSSPSKATTAPSSKPPKSTTKPRSQNNKGGRNSRQSNNGRKKPGKQRNTESFEPSFEPPDMRVLFGPSTKKYNRPYGPHDVVMAPDFFCDTGDLSMYNALVEELKAQDGVQIEKKKRSLFVKWHGDSHLIADDKAMGGKWKEASPTFQAVVKKMEEYFGMDIQATRFNWYEDSSHWKPYHHDRAAKVKCHQNLTVAASFGAERDISFLHAKKHTTISVPQPNGCLYAFGRDVNVDWKHGVMMDKEPYDQGRISIIAWGWVDMDEDAGMMAEGEEGENSTEYSNPSSKAASTANSKVPSAIATPVKSSPHKVSPTPTSQQKSQEGFNLKAMLDAIPSVSSQKETPKEAEATKETTPAQPEETENIEQPSSEEGEALQQQYQQQQQLFDDRVAAHQHTPASFALNIPKWQ